MSSNTILILGDSTSMSIGLEQKTYPYLLAGATAWPSSTRILNCSVPGLTSADGAAFFFQHHRSLANSLSAVVVYLGNCDTASSEVRKGKYSPLKQAVHKFRALTGRAPEKTRLKNRLLHFEWNNTYDPLIESPESPEDFEYNLDRILNTCRQNSVPTILVLPKANLYFLPGIGKGNFVFYRYVGMKEKISEQLTIADSRFLRALRFHEEGDYEQATKLYKEILLLPASVQMSQEYPFVVLNNYASAKAEAGQTEEAIYLFELMLKERAIRKEIVLYNLAQTRKKLGQVDEYSKLIKESYEADDSLYRIRSPYLKVLERLAARYSAVKVIDMAKTVPDEFYLDHCHPLPTGQVKMADAILESFGAIGMSGNQSADIENMLPNPELSLGNSSEFHDYFKTYAPYLESQIRDFIVKLKTVPPDSEAIDWSSPGLAQLPREIRAAVEYYFRHPCFTSVKDIIHFPPRYPSDVGRFPEYFLVRHMIPYLRVHEADQNLVSRFDSSLLLLRKSEELLSILPTRTVTWIESSAPLIEPEYEEIRLALILSKINKLLIQHLRAGNKVFERTKTTIFWYVRESLRFGGHSRVSMLYDRLLLEFLAEGLAVAGVLDSAINSKRSAEIQETLRVLEATTAVHEEFCSGFTIRNCSDEFLEMYNQKLFALADQLEY